MPQKENPQIIDGRDLFQTPNYATELLIPFIPNHVKLVWECAAGRGKIVNRLEKEGYTVIGTDLQENIEFNFLSYTPSFDFDCIVTNPPFSLKRKFFIRCLEFNVPFALLIPADYSGWIIKAVQDGAEKIIPTRRIDYITPTNKDSHSQFHSLWLTWGFNIGQSETFVELTNEMKRNI